MSPLLLMGLCPSIISLLFYKSVELSITRKIESDFSPTTLERVRKILDSSKPCPISIQTTVRLEDCRRTNAAREKFNLRRIAMLFNPVRVGTHPGTTTIRHKYFAVRTKIEIAATPERVWSFSDLEEPQEWNFRAGFAYPMRARIEGTGEGRCDIANSPPDLS